MGEAEYNKAMAVKMKSDTELLNEIIIGRVTNQEATRLDIIATDEEAKKEIKINDETIAKMLKSKDPDERANAKLTLENINNYIKMRGITYEEYKNNGCFEMNAQKSTIIQKKLWEKFISTIKDAKKLSYDKKNELYQAYINNLVKKAKIVFE